MTNKKKNAIEFIRITDERIDFDKYAYFENIKDDGGTIIRIEKARTEYVEAFERSSDFKRIK